MKIHRHLVEEIFIALEAIFSEGLRADKVIEKSLKSHKKWGSRDRKFFAENVYEVVRWKRLLEVLAQSTDIKKIWAVHWLRSQKDLPSDWPELQGLSLPAILQREKAITDLAVRESFPEPLFAVLHAELADSLSQLLPALNRPAEVYLRANTLKITPVELVAHLQKEEIHAELMKDENLPAALKLKERKNVFSSKAFHSGFFEVQDAGSQYIAALLDVQPGQRVVDACAGGGGKTLHLASLMKNKGKILAMDIHEWKLQELKNRARRNSVDIIETRVIDSSKVIKRMHDSADRVLLDVPCSGLGVLRRNPDAKWKVSGEDVQRLRTLQAEILQNYAKMVKLGGKLVYATCSVLPSENEKQVEKFMAANPDKWKLLRQIHLRPDIQGYDGFYAALLERLS